MAPFTSCLQRLGPAEKEFWRIPLRLESAEGKFGEGIQAAVTHNSEGGIQSATAAALMAHFFVYQYGSLTRLPHWINSNVEGNWSRPFEGKVGSKGWMSVSAAITAVSRNSSLAELLMDCMNFGGDVDTVATIALAAASCSSDYTRDIPEILVDELENGKYGRDYIMELDAKLAELVPAE